MCIRDSSGQMEEWENEDSMYDEGGYLYKISRIIKSLQYCADVYKRQAMMLRQCRKM